MDYYIVTEFSHYSKSIIRCKVLLTEEDAEDYFMTLLSAKVHVKDNIDWKHALECYYIDNEDYVIQINKSRQR
jgi:hypothetical protein